MKRQRSQGPIDKIDDESSLDNVRDSKILIKELHFPRLKQQPKRCLQFFIAFLFSQYFLYVFYGIGFAVLVVYLGIISTRTVLFLTVIYISQLLVYKPQNEKGWPYKWLLHNPLLDYIMHYYNSTCIREGGILDPNKQYMFAFVPHGIFGVCRVFSGGTCWSRMFPGVYGRWGSFGAAYYIPGVREFSLSVGTLDASRPVMEKAIKRGENIILLPGGIKEMMLTDGNSTDTKLVILDRKGFCKLAIRNGMDIVPCFCFGEKWIHDMVMLPLSWRNWLYSRFKVAGTFCVGRFGTFLGKTKRKNGVPINLGMVFGRPIVVNKVEGDVPPEYLDEIHQQYLDATRDIFERYKTRFGYSSNETLTFVSSKSTKQHNKL